MKTITKALIAVLAVSLSSYQFVSAATATVTMTFAQGSGTPAVGQEVTCYVQPPKSGVTPVPPQYTYLTANSNGVAVWQPTLVDGATEYKCSPRTALTPDNCYYWGSSGSTGAMVLTDGQTKTFAFTATTASTSTCNKPLQTEAQITQQQTNTPKPTTTTTQPQVVAVPEITSTTVNGKQSSPGDKLELVVGQSLVVSGKTTPGGKVIVTVYSDPIETTVTADDTGVWKFDVASLKNLPTGDHRVEVVAINAAGVKSTATTPIAFTLKAAASATDALTDKRADPDPAPPTKSYAPLVVSLLLFLIAAAMIVWGLRMRRKSSHTARVPTVPKSAEVSKHDTIS